jgi:hypothetical protein
MVSSVNVCCTRVDVASMTGESPTTVSVSANAATSSATFTVAVKLIAIRMPARSSFWNPDSS